jgi:hypothetical protein
MSIHYLAIGHLTRDLTADGARLGGTVAFAALTARAMGYGPGIVTSFGQEAPLSALAGIALHQKTAPHTTTFENRYQNGARLQFLRGRAADLAADDVPTEWLRAPLIHLAPVAREVDQGLTAAFPGAYIGLTPQGWLREWDEAGRVTTGTDGDRLMQTLAATTATVLSLEDVGSDWAVIESWARQAPVLAVTRGKEGATVFVRQAGARDFKAPPQREVDPTGAGDIFAAAFFIHHYETGDPWAAARVANHIASISVTRVGLEGVPTTEDVGLARLRAETT